MSAFLTDTYMDAVLDQIWGDDGFPTLPATWYIALFTTMPGPDGTGGVEATFTGYVRVAVTNDLTQWPAASAGVKSNANPVDYGVAGSGPTSIVGFGFYDDPTAGNLWYACETDGGTVIIGNGADASFSSGTIIIERCA